MASVAQTKATVKYIKEHTKTYVFRCNLDGDADIIKFLAGKDNVSGYIKELLRREAKKDI